LQANFGLSLSSSVESNRSFAQSSTVLVKRRDYVGTVALANIRDNYILPTFRDEWLLNSEVTPAELIANFGTHIMLNVYLGGRLDMNYVLENEEGKSESEIRAGLQASYKVVSGSMDMSLTEANSFRNSSRSETIRTTGGSVGIDMITFDNARNNYSQWAESVENTDNLTLIRAGRLNLITEMLPIWELIDPDGIHADRRTAIYDEFYHQIDVLGITIEGLQKPGEKPVFTIQNGVIYNIQNLHSLKNIDVAGRSTNDNAGLEIWDPANTTSQHWRAVASLAFPGYFHFVNVNSGKFMDVQRASINESLIQYTSNGTPAQLFRVQAVNDTNDSVYIFVHNNLAGWNQHRLTVHLPHNNGRRIGFINNTSTQSRWLFIRVN
jgi:hypothetical protein